MDVPALDKVPGYRIYIGGFISLRRPKALANCRITHILSVIDWKFADDSPLIRGYQHMHIPVHDIDDENLIEWFPKSNAFIEHGLNYWQHDGQSPNLNQSQKRDIDGSNGVFVHCAMGKSRSATIIIAYLLWLSHRNCPAPNPVPDANPTPIKSRDPTPPFDERLTPESALALLRQGRPFAEPNDGFMEQLHLYHSMGCPESIDLHPKYQRWLYKKAIHESLNIHRAPEVDFVRFEDEHEGDPLENSISGVQRDIDVRCRKCRRLLAKSDFLIEHEPPPLPLKQQSQPRYVKDCAHLFLHPLSWMRATLKQGELDGRLCCPNPKCGANVGKFAWQGMRCSCGGWVTPGFGLARGKVDEIPVSGKTRDEDAVGVATAALRLPPGMRKEGGNL